MINIIGSIWSKAVIFYSMKRVISFSLAILLFVVSVKVGLAFHYCGGKLAQFKIVIGYGKASCGMESHGNCCENKSTASFHNVPCCHDQLQQIRTDNYQLATNSFAVPSGLISTIVQIKNCFFGKELNLISFQSYRPPPNLTNVSLPFIRVFQV